MANSEEEQPSESALWSPDTKRVATTGGNEVCVMKFFLQDLSYPQLFPQSFGYRNI